MSIGRPSSFSDAVAEDILSQIAEGHSLIAICGDSDMPDYRTVMRWIEGNESFRHNYARAREDQADYYADKISEVATQEPSIVEGRVDPGEVAHRRLEIDALKWIACKLKPKKYGDIGTTNNVNVGVVVSGITEDQRAQILEKKQQAIQWQKQHRTPAKLTNGSNGNGTNGNH